MFDKFGNYRNRTNIGEYKLYFFDIDSYSEISLDNIILEHMKYSNLGYIKVNDKELDYKLLKPYFKIKIRLFYLLCARTLSSVNTQTVSYNQIINKTNINNCIIQESSVFLLIPPLRILSI